MKKIISIILCVVLLLGIIPSGVFSVGALTSGNYTYTVSNGKATITDCKTSISGSITIPSTLGGYPVTTIGSYAFYNCTSLTSVTIPNSVTTIGNYAFEYCKSLTSITIPNSVTTIGSYAFSSCESLTSVTIGNSVTTIGEYAFEYCTSLTSVTIPDSVTTIGNSAFYKCTSLTSVTIGNSVTTIGEYAFRDCTSLTSVTIPDSVTTIGNDAFFYCTSLKYVCYTGSQEDKNKITIGSYNSSLTNKTWIYNSFHLLDSTYTYAVSNGNATILYLNENLSGAVTIPSTLGGYPVTAIGKEAFYNCISLTSVTIPDSVTTIGNYAFQYCTSLTSVTIGNNVTTIGDYAFSYCESLTSVTIPNSVTTIGSSAFSNCRSLTSVTIGNSVTTIGDNAFYKCTSLTSITIPDSVTTIGDDALFYCTSLTSITIGNSVTTIGSSAFSNCRSLTSVTIGNSVTTIGNSAFEYCTSLKYVSYTGSQEDKNKITIGSYNSSLTNKTWIYNSFHLLDSTYTYAVSNGNATILYLNENLSGAVTIPSTLGGYPVTAIGDRVFYNNDDIVSVIIPNSVTVIGGYAFYDCDALASVTMGDGITTIGEDAFYSCDALKNITIGYNLTTVGYSAFSGCSALQNVYYKGTAEDWAKISIGSSNSYLTNANRYYLGNECQHIYSSNSDYECNKCGKIRYYYFTSSNSGVTITDCDTKISGKIEIPATLGGLPVTSIGSSAFADCNLITSVTIPNTVTSIGSYAFKNCTVLSSITIPDSVTTINSNAFENCYALTTATIGNGVTTLGSNTFLNCYSLSNIALGDSVKTINSSAIINYKTLKNITVSENNSYFSSKDGVLFNKDKTKLILCPAGKTGEYVIPSSVTEIGVDAFLGCDSITKITIPNAVTSLFDYAFKDCTSLESIVIGSGVNFIGYFAFENCYALKDVYYYGYEQDANNIVISFNNDYLTNATWHYEKEEVIEDPWYLTYTVSNGEATITGCNQSVSGDVVIPSTLGGYPVTSIGDGAFVECQNLTSITIPEGVKSIGYCAFENCTSLTSVIILEGVTSIGEAAFVYCDSITTIVIPKSVTNIGGYAFDGCSSLVSITIPENVVSIGDKAFRFCSSLTNITVSENNENYSSVEGVLFNKNKTTLICCPPRKSGTYIIPEGVTSIVDCAFRFCKFLTSITISKNVTSIGRGAFIECSSLTSITVVENNENYSSVDGVLFNKDKTQLIYCPEGKSGSCVIPESVTSIGDEAFFGCSKLTDVFYKGTEKQAENIMIGNYNDNLTNATWHYEKEEIIEDPWYLTYTVSNGEATITGCDTSISGDVIIPSTLGGYPVTAIADYAFYGCNLLTNIELPKGITTIGSGAFNSCSALVSVIIPESVTSIGLGAFSWCNSLESIEVSENSDYFVSEDGILFNKDKTTIICYPASKTETTYTVPESVTTIGSRAFLGCTYLVSITIPNSVTSIGNDAFYSCSSLKDVYYNGCKAKADKISKGSGNTALTNAVWHYEPNTDFDGDNVTDKKDYQYIADVYTGKIKVQKKAEIYDMNGDGEFDIRDIVAIKEIINA